MLVNKIMQFRLYNTNLNTNVTSSHDYWVVQCTPYFGMAIGYLVQVQFNAKKTLLPYTIPTELT